jgi:hypothetical protein
MNMREHVTPASEMSTDKVTIHFNFLGNVWMLGKNLRRDNTRDWKIKGVAKISCNSKHHKAGTTLLMVLGHVH